MKWQLITLITLLLASVCFSVPAQVESSAESTANQLETKKRFKISPEMQAAMDAKRTEQSAEVLDWQQTASKYVTSGFVHIVPKGLDHILFVLGLFFSSIVFSKLIWQVTAFTLAHTLTLMLASLGIVSISSSVVEPLIALSIVYVAVENIRTTTPDNKRIAVVFLFGLLHGLGFASVLSDFGLGKDLFVTSLLSFNIGVELGQLSVLLVAFLLFYYVSKKPQYRRYVQIPASLLIGGTGLFWMVDRLF